MSQIDKLNKYKLWTALITPLTPGLEVDFPALENLIKEQNDAGNGILLLGSTGEALNLSLETRKSIVEFAIEVSDHPYMVGVGGHDLAAQMSWIKWLETKNIASYLMVTPIYAKPESQGQYLWFKSLMDKVTRPVMLYNVPGRAAKELSYEAVTKLSSHPNFWAIKEASGSVEVMKNYLAAASGGKVYCGDDGLMPLFANAGATGLVSVASNTWPKETALYVKKSLEKNMPAADMWNDAANSLFIASNPIPAKALLASEGRISHSTMMPPLYEGDLKDLNKLKISSANVRDWYKKNK